MREVQSVYEQEMHSAGPEVVSNDDDKSSVMIRIDDADGGEYVVLNAYEWAIDNEEEARQLFDAILQKLKACRA